MTINQQHSTAATRTLSTETCASGIVKSTFVVSNLPTILPMPQASTVIQYAAVNGTPEEKRLRATESATQIVQTTSEQVSARAAYIVVETL